MTTKHCPKCLVSREYIEQVDAGPVTAGEVTTCGNEFCLCHTSPVSEVIAKAVKEFNELIYSDTDGVLSVRPSPSEWLTTTLNRVASVAREEGMNQSDLEEIYKNKIQFGAQAMKEKIVAALNNMLPQADTITVRERAAQE